MKVPRSNCARCQQADLDSESEEALNNAPIPSRLVAGMTHADSAFPTFDASELAFLDDRCVHHTEALDIVHGVVVVAAASPG